VGQTMAGLIQAETLPSERLEQPQLVTDR
jgi:hypothetical protein